MHDPFESVVELDWHPSRGVLRRFGIAAALLFAWFAFSSYRHGLPSSLSAAFGACAAMCVAFSWRKPTWNRPLYLALACLSFPLRWLLAWAALILLFFTVLTPVALVVRRLRNQAAHNDGSAWLPARKRREKARYFDQS